MMLRMPVMKAIPIAALNPIRAISHMNRKLSNATPITSTIRPTKYLERRCSMSPIAAITRLSILSGTSAPIILRNSIWSFRKKNEMNTTEKMPTPMDTKNDATYSISEDNEPRSNVFLMNDPTAFSIRKSGPN